MEEAIFRKENPTVAEYYEKRLLMQPVEILPATLRGYTINVDKYVVESLGSMYLSDVAADDVRLALIPLAIKLAELYNTVNTLLKCAFYSAERSRLLDYDLREGISAKGGRQAKRKEALADKQIKMLLGVVKELSSYMLITIILYFGLRRKEILGFQWDCMFLDAPVPYISVKRA